MDGIHRPNKPPVRHKKKTTWSTTHEPDLRPQASYTQMIELHGLHQLCANSPSTMPSTPLNEPTLSNFDIFKAFDAGNLRTSCASRRENASENIDDNSYHDHPPPAAISECMSAAVNRDNLRCPVVYRTISVGRSDVVNNHKFVQVDDVIQSKMFFQPNMFINQPDLLHSFVGNAEV